METIAVDLPREEVFEKILDHLRREKYFWVYGKRGYDIRNLIPPSRIEVILGWIVTGKMVIEVVPSNGKSLVKMDFEWLDGRTILLGLAILPLISALINVYLMPITAMFALPFFVGWLDVGWGKSRLMMELKQLFQNHITSYGSSGKGDSE